MKKRNIAKRIKRNIAKRIELKEKVNFFLFSFKCTIRLRIYMRTIDRACFGEYVYMSIKIARRVYKKRRKQLTCDYRKPDDLFV